jgi:hypothetical protein
MDNEWFVVDSDPLYFDADTGRYHVVVRCISKPNCVTTQFVADFGTRAGAKEDAIEVVKAHNDKLKRKAKLAAS